RGRASGTKKLDSRRNVSRNDDDVVDSPEIESHVGGAEWSDGLRGLRAQVFDGRGRRARNDGLVLVERGDRLANPVFALGGVVLAIGFFNFVEVNLHGTNLFRRAFSSRIQTVEEKVSPEELYL